MGRRISKLQRVLFCSLLVLFLLLVGCGKQTEMEKPAPEPTATAPTAEALKPSEGQPVQEINYEEIFRLQYCNMTIAHLDYSVTEARKELEDAENDLGDAEEELNEATEQGDQDEIASMRNQITEEKNRIGDAKSLMEDGKEALAARINECNRMEKKIDKTLCTEFISDAAKQVEEVEANLQRDQEELQQVIDAGQTSRIPKYRRGVARSEVVVERWGHALNELRQRCGE